MASTTNFDEWLDNVDPSYYTDTYALHEAVDGETEFAGFNAVRAANGSLIVTDPTNVQTLVLISETAKQAFLNLICARYVEGGMDIGAWYAMNQANDSDN